MTEQQETRFEQLVNDKNTEFAVIENIDVIATDTPDEYIFVDRYRLTTVPSC